MNIQEVVEKSLPNLTEYEYGFANLTNLLSEQYQHWKYVIVIAIKLNDVIIDSVKAGPNANYLQHYSETSEKLTNIICTIAKQLDSMKISNLPIPPNIRGENKEDYYKQKLRSRFSHKMAATRAGLGWIGKTGMLISQKFGARVRLASILVDIPLKPLHIPIDESLCGNCQVCVNLCPVHAANGKLWNIHIDRDEFLDVFRCRQNCKDLTKNKLNIDASHCCICLSNCVYHLKSESKPFL